MVTRLTDRTVRSLRPKHGGLQGEMFDADARGLSARCSALGRVTWSFTYTSPITRKRRRKTIGTYPAWSLAEARAKSLDLRRIVESGRDPIVDEEAIAERITVAQLFRRYIIVIEKTHRGHREVRRSIERDILPEIGDRPAEDVKRRDIINILDVIANRGAPVYANRVRSMLSAMWSWAISEDVADFEVNPASNIKNRIAEVPRTRWLSDTEIKKLAPHLNALPPAKRDTIKLILLTGQRPGEVAGIRSREINLDKGLWIIPAERSKNNRRHVVPLVGEAKKILSRLMECACQNELARHDDRLLLIRERGVRPLQVNNLNWALRAAVEAANVDPAKPHDLRRTALTHLGRLGIDPLVIGHIANHASVARATVTASVYIQYDYLPQKQQALNAWDVELGYLLRGEDPPSAFGNVVALRA